MSTYEFPIRSFYINKHGELYIQMYKNENQVMYKHIGKNVTINFGKIQIYGCVNRLTKSAVYFKDWSFIQ